MSNTLIENWTNYSMRLRKTVNPDFFKIRNLSSEFVTKLPQEAQDELYNEMNRGALPLGSEPEMSMYMFAYGKMHYEKLLRTFEQIPTAFFENQIEIIDYGCGQAMGLIAYADFIRQKGYSQTITNITLIEPSNLTISRAILHANQIFPNVPVNAVCKSLDDLEDTDIQTDASTQKLHIFSNIIDVELFSIIQLSNFIKQKFDGNNQFVCVSPFFGSGNSRTNRLDEFINLIATSNVYSENLGKNDWINGWTCSIRVFANNRQSNVKVTNSETVIDIDGNGYKTVQIGNQIWMAENLRVSKYRNGDLIPNIQNNEEWINLELGAWCNYDNNPENDDKYGKLYNCYTVNYKRCLAPEGWHIPSDEEWEILIDYLGGIEVASGKLKENGSENWKMPNEGDTNESGFSALWSGCRNFNNGIFDKQKNYGYWLSTTYDNTHGSNKTGGLKGYMCNEINRVWHSYCFNKGGYSIRCVKNIEINAVADIDGNVYKTVQIGNQIWMAENLRVSKYRNGDLIPNIQNNEEWINLELGAWCNYDNNPNYDLKYGKFYNWYAINDKREIAPKGWHIPNKKEWNMLIDFLGGDEDVVSKLKIEDISHWSAAKEDLIISSGFSAIPCGSRNGRISPFDDAGSLSYWWIAAVSKTSLSWGIVMGKWLNHYGTDKSNGLSVRCIKDKPDHVIDIDGNEYKTVQIGNQVWMAENLRVSRYRNGDLIQNIQDSEEWTFLENGAWSNYDNDFSYDSIYGKLYNWFSINDVRNIAPIGWHVASDEEWTMLNVFLGGKEVSGGKLKEAGTEHWTEQNEGATNETGFSALGGGARSIYFGYLGEPYSDFNFLTEIGYWWSSTKDNFMSEDGNNPHAYGRYMYSNTNFVARDFTDKKNGRSVRCIKDE